MYIKQCWSYFSLYFIATKIAISLAKYFENKIMSYLKIHTKNVYGYEHNYYTLLDFTHSKIYGIFSKLVKYVFDLQFLFLNNSFNNILMIHLLVHFCDCYL
jgi:hypothetical protein